MKRILSYLMGDSSTPSEGQVRKAIKQVTEPHGDPAVRMAAADRLKGWGSREAIAGLLRRFTITIDAPTRDQEECQEIERMLVELGRPAVGPILAFLAREAQVALPARALEKILPAEEFVTELLAVLERLEAGFASHNEQRAGLLIALAHHDDPRIAPGVRRFLSDPDDDVANAAIACIVRRRDPAFLPDLIEALLKTADRPRVRRELAEKLAELGLPLEEQKKAVRGALPPGFGVDAQGRVVVSPRS